MDLPDHVPQMRVDDAYPHMGIPRSIGGDRKFLMKKLRKGTVTLVAKLKRVNLDRGQHIRCANCLKGSYSGYYCRRRPYHGRVGRIGTTVEDGISVHLQAPASCTRCALLRRGS